MDWDNFASEASILQDLEQVAIETSDPDVLICIVIILGLLTGLLLALMFVKGWDG